MNKNNGGNTLADEGSVQNPQQNSYNVPISKLRKAENAIIEHKRENKQLRDTIKDLQNLADSSLNQDYKDDKLEDIKIKINNLKQRGDWDDGALDLFDVIESLIKANENLSKNAIEQVNSLRKEIREKTESNENYQFVKQNLEQKIVQLKQDYPELNYINSDVILNWLISTGEINNHENTIEIILLKLYGIKLSEIEFKPSNSMNNHNDNNYINWETEDIINWTVKDWAEKLPLLNEAVDTGNKYALAAYSRYRSAKALKK